MRLRGRWAKLRPCRVCARSGSTTWPEIPVAVKAELTEPDLARYIVATLERHVAAGGRLNLR